MRNLRSPLQVRRSPRRLAILIGVASLLWPLSLHASTFVAMSESDLAARSVAAVIGSVTAIEAVADDATGGVNTYIHIAPDEIVFGELPSGEVVLREVGGRLRDRTEWIFGSPEYRVGERVLVFVSSHADGSLRTTGLSMGKFSIDVADKRATAVRRLGEGASTWDPRTGLLAPSLGPEEYELAALLRQVRATAKERPRDTRHRVIIRSQPPELVQASVREPHEAFTYLSSPSRWFEPDDGQPVSYAIDGAGDVGLGPAVSAAAVHDAFAAWSDIASSSIALVDGGSLAAPIGYAGCSGGNRIVFNDPFNEIADPVSCAGVLAVGGFCSSAETRTVNGTSFRRIRVGKIMFNNGWSNCPGWNRCNLAEVAAHELGHTLGFGHSTDVNATMYAAAHFDGRCAALRSDDIAGATFVYPNATSPSATPTVTALPASATATAVRTPSPLPSVTPTAPRAASATMTAVMAIASPTAVSYSPTATASATSTLIAPSPTVTITQHRVLGRVAYYASDRAVPDVAVTLGSSRSNTAQTGEDGDYELSLPEGTWEVAPEKDGDLMNAVSPLDAAYVLEAVSGRRELDDMQRLACDTTGDGRLSALDAVRILQLSVGLRDRLPVAELCGSDWLFLPDPLQSPPGALIEPTVGGGSCSGGKIILEDLRDEAVGQNFRAVLFGDCTGNWQPPSAALRRTSGHPARVRLGRAVVRDGHALVPVYVRSAEPYRAVQLQVTFDAARLHPVNAALRRSNTGALSSWSMIAPQTLQVSVASAQPIARRSAALLVLDFVVEGQVAVRPTAVAAQIDDRNAVIAGD